MRNLSITSVVLVLAAVSLGGQQNGNRSDCRAAGELVRIEQLPEASGVAASRRTPGVFWAHNDSGEPVLFALNQDGAVVGRVRVTGAEVEDWEDVAVGPCEAGSCLYIGDIGNNEGKREHVTVYRLPEPDPKDTATVPAERFDAAYPDGSHDAESLFVTESGLYIVTKGDPGPVALYRFPRSSSGGTARLERVGEPLATAQVASRDRPTAAEVSPDGRSVAVRTTDYVVFYPTADLTAGRWREASRANVTSAGEGRGEGLTFGSDGQLVLVGEQANLGGRGGTFARLSCR